MVAIIKGKLVCGWRIAYPAPGNDYSYEATSPARPGEVRRFKHLGDAEGWCQRHDVLAADLRRARQGR